MGLAYKNSSINIEEVRNLMKERPEGAVTFKMFEEIFVSRRGE